MTWQDILGNLTVLGDAPPDVAELASEYQQVKVLVLSRSVWPWSFLSINDRT